MQSSLTAAEINLLNGLHAGGPLGARSNQILLGTRLFDLETVVRAISQADIPIKVANNTGGTLTAGTLVTGPTSWDATTGNEAFDVVKADADDPALQATFVLVEDIINGNTGYARGVWLQEDIDTSGYSAADVALYLSATAGGHTESAPTGAAQFVQTVGYVAVKSATLGKIFWCPGLGLISKQGTNFLQGIAVTAAKIALARGYILRGKNDTSGQAEALDLHVADTIPIGDGTDVATMVLPTTGIVAKTAAGTAAGRTISGGVAAVTVANGDGVGGNPAISVANAVSGGNAGLMTGTDKADHDSLVAGGAGFWSDTADGNIGTRRFVEIDAGGNLVAGSVDSDSVVGVGLNAAPVVSTDPIVVAIGRRGLLAADAILAGAELKCAEDGMAISAVTANNGKAGASIGGGAGLGFTNQPANDQITIESTDAGDTNVAITVIGTTHGGLVVVEEIKSTDGANGTTPVDSVKVDWGLLLAVKKPVTLGNIVIKEKSGGLTIATILTADTSSGVIAVAAGNQQSYNAKPEFAADAGTTKTVGCKRIATTGTTETYAAVTLNGTVKQKLATACRRVTELYVGDLEAARTLAVTTTATADSSEVRCGRAYSAAAARGDSFTGLVRP